jgi:class 3 adenylate cyclase/tetratricopeptide (TPR) repeat protein
VLTIRQWLAELGLEQYAASFESNDVDIDLLPTLSDGDLHALGVSLGHRKRILLALRNTNPPATERTPIDGIAVSLPAQPMDEEGERRLVTVLFCDLVGSTALSNSRDPEEYRAVLARYHEACVACVQRFEGFVAQVQGDGILAYFGYPLAHEGEAERAIRSALSIVQTLAGLDVGLEQRLNVRIGVASGLVVVSHVLAPQKSAVGETPNLAQRLQTLARPGEVLLSERTRTLAKGVFDYEDRGRQLLKGIAEPVRVWRVLGPSGAASRFDAATGGHITPMVGREQEIALLADRWEHARRGEGQIVLLEGEPGIGKSRMLRAFRQRLDGQIETALQYQCSPYFVYSAFYPIVNHIERALRFEPDDDVEQRLDRIEHRLIDELGRSRIDCHLLARALSLPCEDRYGSLEMSPQRQKDETIAVLVNMVATIARRQASAVLFEDAHWADPSTIEVLDALVHRAQKLPLLVLITFRPEFSPPWLDCPHVTHVRLGRLSRAQAASIVLRVAEDKPLPEELIEKIVDKTDGVPLFLEELTKTVLESEMLVDVGGRYDYLGAVREFAVPATLQDSLTARLDRLVPVKEIAQIGSVLGREFSYELVRAVSQMSDAELDEALERLTDSELVFRRGAPPHASYIFKHALVQDAAYDSLLKSKRRALHARAAEVIHERFPSKVSTAPELLAHHYTEAGAIATAIPYWQKAGELAQQRVALQEAIRYYERGLELTSTLPASAERDTWELRLRALLGIAWVELHGYAHPQVEASLAPALRLDQFLDDGNYTLRVFWGMWVYTLCVGRIEKSLDWAVRLIALAEARDSENMRLAGHWAACDSHYFLGNFARCVEHADMILSRYDMARDRHIADLINHDPKTIALAYRAAAEWRLGFPVRAGASAEAALAHSLRRRHVFDLCWVRTFLSHTVFIDARDTESMRACLDEAERIAADQKLAFFTDVYCPMVRACWLLRCGHAADAETRFREVIKAWVNAGLGIYVPTIRTLHAESLLLGGHIAQALQLLDEALRFIEQEEFGERSGLSDVLRLKACALRSAGDSDEAENLFRNALKVARKQEARSWELRAALDYARLLTDQGRSDEASALLQPLYERFDEGHDTRDLRETAAQLAGLRRASRDAGAGSASGRAA